jgi:acyl carrier protein
MQNTMQGRASQVVRAAIARYLVVPVEQVAPHQCFERDLLIDELELAVIVLAIQAKLGKRLDCGRLTTSATVETLEEIVRQTILRTARTLQ